ncbi:MAG: 3-phosphoshikimate 1-carboxyvinyltransferase [Actinomycetota bacterium]
MSDATIIPCRRVEGSVGAPGDKSISQRALIVGAIGEGTMVISGLSRAADPASTLEAVRKLLMPTLDFQPRVETEPSSSKSRVFQILLRSPGISRWASPRDDLDAGNSGTAIRLLLGALAGSSIEANLTGDESIRRRPMGRVVEPLRRMGAQIEGEGGGELAPLHVVGAPLHGVTHELPVASAQVKSALLLAGLQAAGETTVIEPGPSRDHTERLLRYLGVPIDAEPNRLSVKSTNIQNADIEIPGDLSSAAFMLVAAAILPGSDVTIEHVGVNPTRSGVLDCLRAFGADVEVANAVERCGEPAGSVRVRPGDRRPLEVSGDLVVRTVDELPLVAVLGTTAEGLTVVRDAAELRVKESDRIATIVEGLRLMGAAIKGTPDGFEVQGPSRLQGAVVDAAGDHRIAMALAIAALTADGETTIRGWESVGVSYPGFDQDLEHLVVR